MVCTWLDYSSLILFSPLEANIMIFLRDIMDDLFNGLDSEHDDELTIQFLSVLHAIIRAILKSKAIESTPVAPFIV